MPEARASAHHALRRLALGVHDLRRAAAEHGNVMTIYKPIYEDHRIEFELPPMYEKQYAALFDTHRYSLIEASTKAGKTSGAIIWLTTKALRGARGQNFCWVAPVSTQADIAYTRALNAMQPDLRTANITHKTITLLNGAIMWFKSADHPDTLYGDDVWACVIDEEIGRASCRERV